MVKPTPIRKRVDGRSRKQKLSAVMAADMVGVVAASEQSGIPESTIRYWLDDPKFADFRVKAREAMAEEVKVTAHLAWRRVALTMDAMEPRDAIFAAVKATEMYQLLSGQPTDRIETLTGGLNDHEREALRAVIGEVVRS